MTMQNSLCTALGVTNRNANFIFVMYMHRKTWTMITHLHYYFGVGTPGHEIINDKWLRFFALTWNL